LKAEVFERSLRCRRHGGGYGWRAWKARARRRDPREGKFLEAESKRV
jgi:hypothetical protein